MQINQRLNSKIIIATIFSSFLAPFMSSAVNIAVPKIAKELNLNAIEANFIVLSFILFSAAFMLPIGKIADSFSRSKLFLFGNILFLISSVGCMLSKGFLSLIIFRCIQGASSSFIFATSMPILISHNPPQYRGRLLGYNTAAVYLGISLGPFVGGIIIDSIGYSGIFLFSAIISLISVLLIIIAKKEIIEEEKLISLKDFDIKGSLFAIIGLNLLMYGASTFSYSIINKILFILGILSVVLLIIVEKNVKNPLVDIKIFSNNKPFIFSNLAALINYCATYGAGYMVSLYLQNVKGIDAKAAGIIMIIQPIFQIILSILSGRISEKKNPTIIATLGMILLSIGLLIYVTFTQNTPFYLLYINLIIMGVGFGLFSSPNTNVVMSSVKKEFFSIASSIISEMRLVGQAFSMAIISIVFSIFFKGTKGLFDKIALMNSFKLIFAVFFILSIFGILASLVRVERKNANEN
ncbi:MFS transporter [Caldicellulosiruptoraceae bacterium PP1]